MVDSTAQNFAAVLPDPEIDTLLMRSIAQADADALSQLYDRYSPRLLGLLFRMLGDRRDAEETLIELFYEVWDRADRYDVNRGCVSTYLMTLARSRAIDRRRRRAARPDMDPARSRPIDLADGEEGRARSTQWSPLQGALFEEQSRVIRSAMEQLDNVQRQAIELSFFDGLSHSEIASKLKRPLGTVKTWIRQGLTSLRDSLHGFELH